MITSVKFKPENETNRFLSDIARCTDNPATLEQLAKFILTPNENKIYYSNDLSIGRVKDAILENPKTSEKVLKKFLKDSDYFSRAIIVGRSNLSKALLTELQNDKNFYITLLLVKSNTCNKWYYTSVIERLIKLDFNNTKKWPDKAGEDTFLLEQLVELIKVLREHKYSNKEIKESLQEIEIKAKKLCTKVRGW